MRSDADNGGVGDGIFPSLRIRNGVALIGLSSARATAPFLATGALGRAQLQRLQMLLEQAAAQQLFRVVLLHHPPRPEDEQWRKRLTDGRALCEVLGRAGAELVLHGHSHRSLHSELGVGGRRIPVFGIPSASAIGSREGRRAQYYLYRVRRDGDCWSVEVMVRAYQPHKDRFCLQHEHHLSLPVMASTSL